VLRVPTLDKRQVCCLKIFRKEANRNLLQQARLVVVASAIPVETCKKVASVPGPKTANLIFTLDRKQKYFGAFFKEPFERMCYGQEMLFACVQIAPQGPLQRDDIPAKVLIAEAGKLTRAQSSPWLLQIGFEKLLATIRAATASRASPKQDQ